MNTAFIRFGHGYEVSDRGRCEAFDGFDVVAAPLGEFDNAARESRSFPRKDGRPGVTYGSHAIKLARMSGPFSSGLYILMQHGGGREVLSVPSFYDNGDLDAHILAMPERLQYALLYTIWKTARNARTEANEETGKRWAMAFAEGRIKKRRAARGRPATVEIEPPPIKPKVDGRITLSVGGDDRHAD